VCSAEALSGEVEALAGEAEAFRSFALIAIGVGDGAFDGGALDLGKEVLQRQAQVEEGGAALVVRFRRVLPELLLANLAGEGLDADDGVVVGRGDEAVDLGGELADVARPVVEQEQGAGVGAEGDRAAEGLLVLVEEVVEDGLDIFATFAERGDFDSEGVERPPMFTSSRSSPG